MSAVKKTPSKQKQAMNKTPVKSTGKKQVNGQGKNIVSLSGSKNKNITTINDIKKRFLQNQDSSTTSVQDLHTQLIQILNNEDIQQANSLFVKVLNLKTNQNTVTRSLRKLDSQELNGVIYLIVQQITSQKDPSNKQNLCAWISAINLLNPDLIMCKQQIKTFINERAEAAVEQKLLLQNIQGKIQLLIGF